MTERTICQLMQREASEETVEALRVLLRRAKRGDLVGLGFVGLYRGGRHTIGVTGECRKSATLTRGIVAELDDLLARMKRN